MDLVKSKIKKLYPDADFSSLTFDELNDFINLIQDGLTKSHFDDSITQLKLIAKQYVFNENKEPSLKLMVKIKHKNSCFDELLNITCYAFDVKIEEKDNETLQNICCKSWIKLMISKFKRNYCDGLSNYILGQRVRLGQQVAKITTKRLREVIIQKYSVEKEETNQP